MIPPIDCSYPAGCTSSTTAGTISVSPYGTRKTVPPLPRCSVIPHPGRWAIACWESPSIAGATSAARELKLEGALRLRPEGVRTGTILQGLDHFSFCSAYLGKLLWIKSYPEQPLKRSCQTVEEVAGMGHPVTLSVALSCVRLA